jgi:hypothetical protein
MPRTEPASEIAATERQSLRRRVRQMYGRLNKRDWDKCYDLIDPKLREKAAISKSAYADSLRSFIEAYGAIAPWHIRISLHLEKSRNKSDDRPFAYVYVVWKDERYAFHMF